MMLWAAWLRPEAPAAAELAALMAHWAMQFTPRVAWQEEALLLELAASVRLFGGRRALRARLEVGARALLQPEPVCEHSHGRLHQGLPENTHGRKAEQAHNLPGALPGEPPHAAPLRLAWAPTGLAALALARAGLSHGFARPLPELLDPLPLACLSALRPHEAMLHLIGCRSLGELRGLPRAGLARRLDAAALRALDQAYGEQGEAYAWLEPPEQFSAQLELPGRAADVPALMAGAQRLLQGLSGWLAVRQLGVCAFTLRWQYDSMRARSIAPSEALTLRTAAPSREPQHLARLLAEHLARVVLRAPVAALALQADEVQPLRGRSAVLWPGQVQQDESLSQVLERLSARLGPERVLRGQLCADYRPEQMQHWAPAAGPAAAMLAPTSAATLAPSTQRRRARAPTAQAPAALAPSAQTTREAPSAWPAGPQPSFLLPQPQPLAMAGHRPIYQGPLRLLLGPQRVEGGWWAQQPLPACRDYWVAESERAGLLWIFQARLADEAAAAWFLHGFFA